MKTMNVKALRYGRPTPPYRREYLDLASPQSRESMIAVIHVEKAGKKRGKISGVQLTPCVLGDDGEPTECSSEQARAILNRLKTFSEEYGTKTTIRADKGYLRLFPGGRK